jgi:hypothetical protein
MKHLQFDLMEKPGTALATTSGSRALAYSADPATADVVRQCERAIAWRPEHGAPQSHRVPTAPERSVLERRLDDLAAMRRPAYLDRAAEAAVSAAVAAMVARFTSVRPEDRAGVVALLSNDLAKLPAWAVEEACGKISRGEVAGISKTFVPQSPEVYALAKRELAVIQAEESRIRAVLALLPVAGPSDEERVRVSAKFDALRAQLRGDTTAAGETHEQWLTRHGVTQEQFDAIPDAPARAEA